MILLTCIYFVFHLLNRPLHFPCELTLCDFHLRKIRKPFITHIALTATKIYFRAVFFLYTISPANKQRGIIKINIIILNLQQVCF